MKIPFKIITQWAIMPVLISFLIVSCNSDSTTDDGAIVNPPSSTYYLKAKVGENDKNFNKDIRASWVEDKTYLNITGYAGDNTFLTITILNEQNRVPVGQYVLDDASGYHILAIYNETVDGVQNNYTASHGTVWDDAFTFKITELNNTVVKGSFSGELVIGGENMSVAKRIKIENGTFEAPFK